MPVVWEAHFARTRRVCTVVPVLPPYPCIWNILTDNRLVAGYFARRMLSGLHLAAVLPLSLFSGGVVKTLTALSGSVL